MAAVADEEHASIGVQEGFTFVLSALKAFLEHDLLLHLIEDAHPDQRVA